MNVRALIDELTKFLEERGDLPVKIMSYGCAGHYDCYPNNDIDEEAPVILCVAGDGERHAQIESE